MHQPSSINSGQSSHSQQKWNQIQRNLAEQQSFVQSIMGNNTNSSKYGIQNNGDTDNLLSTSIKQAKDKLASLQTQTHNKLQNSRSRDNGSNHSHSHSRDKLSQSRDSAINDRTLHTSSAAHNINSSQLPPHQQNTSLAKAMKKLQQKIIVLQQQKQKLLKQNTRAGQQLHKKQQYIAQLQIASQQTKRKIKNLESSLHNDKKQIKQLQKMLTKYQQKIQNTQKDSQKQKDMGKSLQDKLTASQMLYRAQNQQIRNYTAELQNKQKQIRQLSNICKQQQIRHLEKQRAGQVQRRELQGKLRVLEERDGKRQGLINRLKQQIKGLQIQKKGLLSDRQQMMLVTVSDQNPDNIAVSLNNNIGNKTNNKKLLSPHKNTHPHSSNTLTHSHSHKLQQQLEYHIQKYQQLYTTYKILDDRHKRQKIQCKNFRNKFWELKQLTKQIIEKINCLPNAVTSQLRYRNK